MNENAVKALMSMSDQVWSKMVHATFIDGVTCVIVSIVCIVMAILSCLAIWKQGYIDKKFGIDSEFLQFVCSVIAATCFICGFAMAHIGAYRVVTPETALIMKLITSIN